MKVALQEIFITQPKKRTYKTHELITLVVNPKFVNILTAQLNLYYEENNIEEGHVCFANTTDVRPEFRLFYNKMDIIRYVSSFLPITSFEIETKEVPMPKNAKMFWNIIKSE